MLPIAGRGGRSSTSPRASATPLPRPTRTPSSKARSRRRSRRILAIFHSRERRQADGLDLQRRARDAAEHGR